MRPGTLKNHEPAGGFCERQTVSGFTGKNKMHLFLIYGILSLKEHTRLKM